MSKTYNVIILGARGSGKTVFLASMYKLLSTQGELGFFLEVDSAKKRRRLNNIYTDVARVDKEWPKGTDPNEVSEWNFTCNVQSNLSIYPACHFTYLDYFGGRLTDDELEEDVEFESKLNGADAFLGLLDGHRLSSLMRGETLGNIWMLQELPNILEYMQRTNKPIHFVISKWDILEGKYTLDQIQEKLLKIPAFRNIVTQRNQADSSVRLIPVSSVGMGFAELQADGSMTKTGAMPEPYLVEAPLACILPDMIKQQLKELIKEKEQTEQQQVKVKSNLTFWEKLKKFAGGGAKAVVQSISKRLPKKYQFANSILEDMIDFIDNIEQPIHQKENAAQKQYENLQRKKAESLKAVADQETALKYAIHCFLCIVNRLEAKYPNSTFKS